MRSTSLTCNHATKRIIERAFNIRRASRKHWTSLAQHGCFEDDRSHGWATPKSKRLPSQISRSASTRAQVRDLSLTSTHPLVSTLENQVLKRARTLLESSTVPETVEIEGLFQACEVFAKLIAEETQTSRQTPTSQAIPASNLLSLEEDRHVPRARDRGDVFLSVPAKNAAARAISSTAYGIIIDPKIYITPKLLSAYVNIHSLLNRPQSLPEVFQLYASKPSPKPKTSPLQFTTPNPNKPTAHIPISVADTALSAAIRTKDLPLCFDIINHSVCTRAFQYHKFLRRAFIPISGAVLAPFAIYKLALELSGHLSNMDVAVATDVLFAGILAYVGFTATIGVVAVTTSNDQMDRVTWASGTPLRERWMREEERMLIDRVAGAWGFPQRSKRGEEEGPDWEALREWIGMRAMILDRTELMDGME
ncbi:MAG: hypothetical protein LQ337_007150 [Flavoplaca oasis]|nr:MAG: hypothetical protein LQ337_007150 [Flavoplaca oasis]